MTTEWTIVFVGVGQGIYGYLLGRLHADRIATRQRRALEASARRFAETFGVSE